MSINVTVSGNPISIKRGKMVTSDPNKTKKEFERRRLMRLEQVREQSKHIAQEVRNKVKKEKKKQKNEIEKVAEERLTNWQNQKLLELQNQYRDALEDIGVAHKNALEAEKENEILLQKEEANKKIAKHRGSIAAQKLQVAKNEESYKKSMPLQRKKLVRDIENARSSLVTKVQRKKAKGDESGYKSKRKKRTSADINITLPDSDTDSESSEDSTLEYNSSDEGLPSIPEEEEDQDEEKMPTTSLGCSDESDLPRSPLNLEKVNLRLSNSPPSIPELQKQQNVCLNECKYNAETQTTERTYRIQNNLPEMTKRSVPLDTRISDRIKRREIMASQPDYCDVVAATVPLTQVKSISQVRDLISERPNRQDNFCPANASGTSGYFDSNCPCGMKACPCAANNCSKKQTSHVQTNFYNNANMKTFETTTGTSKNTIPEKSSYTQQKSSVSTNNQHSSDGLKMDFSKKSLEQQKSLSETNQKVNNSKTGQRIFINPSIEQSSDIIDVEIPEKPPIRIKPSHRSTSKSLELSKVPTGSETSSVKFFDRQNKFGSKKQYPPGSFVEKISEDSLEVMPNVVSEAEWYEKARQREKDSRIRGKKALEKVRIQKDYQEMMKKLPLLQREERILQIHQDKPEYHMSEERLKERERIRQNRLENAYLKTLPEFQPAVVNLPRRKLDEEIVQLDDQGSVQSLNVAKWDVDYEGSRMFSAGEVQEIIKAFTEQKPKDRRAKLKDLLKSLKLQKDQLLKEISLLPKDDSLAQLISDLEFVENGTGRTPRKNKKKEHGKSDRKRQREEDNVSNTNVQSSSSSDGKNSEREIIKENVEKGQVPSPRKKVKKSKPKVLVLQNTSTQTTPKPENKSSDKEKEEALNQDIEKQKTKKSVSICENVHVPCDCNKENVKAPEELCQIVIKFKENINPEILFKSKDHKKSLVKLDGIKQPKSKTHSAEEKDKPKEISKNETESDSAVFKSREPTQKSEPTKKNPSAKNKESKKVSPSEKVKEPEEKKAKSWREELSKNSLSTSSTSYLSPPDYGNTKDSQVFSNYSESSKQSFYDLRKKPQQKNLGLSEFHQQNNFTSSTQKDLTQSVDHNMLNYVKRLLSMTKGSVKDLSVSTSTISTPSQSVVEIDSNNPLAHLHNMIKYYHFNVPNLAENLSYSPDGTTRQDFTKTEQSTKTVRTSYSSKSDIPHSSKQDSVESNKSKESILSQYADVTDSCSKRIANLAEMINKLRREKIQILTNPPGSQNLDQIDSEKDLAERSPPATDDDKEHSTMYLELPPESSGVSSSSLDDENLHKKLMEIDLNLGEKLRKFPVQQDQDEPTKSKNSKVGDSNVDQELLNRLQQLMQKGIQESVQDAMQTSSYTATEYDEENPLEFVPFLLDIPILPILEMPPEDGNGTNNSYSGHKKPPPSKGLTVVRKFNGNISQIPHELSTIVEADSQLSTKLGSSHNSLNASRTSQEVSPRKKLDEDKNEPDEDINKDKFLSLKKPEGILKGRELGIPKKSSFEDASTSSTSIDRIMSVHFSSESDKKSTSGSFENIDAIEAMLKSIGMSWAIPTLHKTKEALALSSSSSATDVSSKKVVSCSTSSSDVSLKDFLKRKTKISSSSMKSDGSPGSMLEFSDISAIHTSIASYSGSDKSNRKTSTPIIASKSTNKSKSSAKCTFFSADSDISSVRADSNENTGSFNNLTNKSSKSRKSN